MQRVRMRFLALATLLVVGGVRAPVAGAQTDRAVGATPPRLAFIAGEVSFWRPGADDWAPAQINTALAAGDSLYVGDGGNVELQIGSRAYIRAGSGTQLGVDSLETGYLQLEVTSGHAAIDLKRLADGQVIEVDTPSGAFTIERAGYYRVDVDDSTTFTTRRGGAATVVPAGGETSDIDPDRQIVLAGTETATVTSSAAPDLDDWDRWNFDRTAHLAERPRSAEYVPAPVAGVDDLDSYGEWRDTPRYGHVWVPRDVSADWAPYSTGRWVYDPYYEWTWVDDAPWGWAPYHYGRWCWADGYWGWAPGPVVAVPRYSPALVAFFGGGGVSVGIGVGAPFVSWVALGWGEPIVPWWGPVGFVGHPYWGGWGGPRVVNNVVINQTTIVNARNINRFSNVEGRNAIVGVHRDQFGRGRVEHIHIAAAQARQLQPVRGQIGVRPVAASLVPRAGRAQAPPDRIRNRRVIATRPPQDPSRRLRAAGIETRGPARPVEPRVVQPSRARGHGPSERPRGADRMTSPPPPGRERGAAGERGGPSVEHGRYGAPPSPAGERGRVNERNGVNVEHGRHAAPPPPEEHEPRLERGGPSVEHGPHAAPPAREHAPMNKRGGANVERGRHAPAPPPPGGEREPASEHGGADVGRGRHAAPPPSSVHERAPANERGGASIERRHETAPPPPRDVEPPRSEHGGGERIDRGVSVPRPRERTIEHAAPREQPRPEPARPAMPEARPQRPGAGKHAPVEGGHGRERQQP
ncbi:MAG: hypothetical protein HY271_01175 [Deltaproteobacteria bacterium]|nr:hypothetical protein [Deltaproteobacteria bacterium]